MSFLAPFLLALSAFASIPILLHLIRRKRVRVLELPTFRYLKKAAEQQRVRFHLQDQLLMLLRILVLLLLALAFAGLLGEERPGTSGPVLQPKNLLILDDTLSMSVSDREGTSAYHAAAEFVLDLVWESGADWRVGLASDFLGQRDPENFLAKGHEETVDLIERNPDLEAKGALSDAIGKAKTLLDDQTSLWVVTDAAAANWLNGSVGPISETDAIELIQVKGPSDTANWALTELTLNNQPLLENEPALLTSRVEFFGETKTNPDPPAIQYGLKSESGQSLSDRLEPKEGNPGEFSVQSTIPTEGAIASASAALLFPEGKNDALRRDNQAVLIPRFLEGIEILIVTETEEWAKILKAALVGFDTATASGSDPPSSDAATFSAYVVLLEDGTPDTGWAGFLEQRIQSGAGTLFLFDGNPESVRIQSWTDWWNQLGMTFSMATNYPGEKTFKPGATDWFFQSLDPTAKFTGWAEGEIRSILIEGWESELELGDERGARTPVFQTWKSGQGVACVWGVPLSPNDTSLLYSTAWVPLLSQMVKRTLVDPTSFSGDTFESMRYESRLASLSEEEKGELMEIGYRFYSMEEVAPRVGDLASGRRNWTALILMLCLLLAIAEVGVSNYV